MQDPPSRNIYASYHIIWCAVAEIVWVIVLKVCAPPGELVLLSRQQNEISKSRKRMKRAKFRWILEYIQDGIDNPTYLKFEIGGLSYSKINTFVNLVDATKLM